MSKPGAACAITCTVNTNLLYSYCNNSWDHGYESREQLNPTIVHYMVTKDHIATYTILCLSLN